MEQNAKIIQYYEECEDDYRCFWDLDRSLAMHAGYWDQTTRTLNQALEKENEVLAKLAKIKSADQVLDAGCGIGGSSIYIAQKYGCQVTGITLSAKQTDTAARIAYEHKITPLPRFQVANFTSTPFPDESFDVVWGIESICHTDDKERFIKEAFRLLKPKGRLVIADAFATKSSYSEKEQRMMNIWLNGWRVNTIDTAKEFMEKMKKSGFQSIQYQNVTKNILPSSKRLYFISFPALIYSWIGQFFGYRSKMQTNNIKSARYQYLTLKKNLWEYGFVYGEKN